MSNYIPQRTINELASLLADLCWNCLVNHIHNHWVPLKILRKIRFYNRILRICSDIVFTNLPRDLDDIIHGCIYMMYVVANENHKCYLLIVTSGAGASAGTGLTKLGSCHVSRHGWISSSVVNCWMLCTMLPLYCGQQSKIISTINDS